MNINENNSFHLNDFLRQVLQKIMHKKTKGNITTHPSIPRPSYSSPASLPKPTKSRKSPTSPKRSGKTGSAKQLTLPLSVDKSKVPKPYSDGRKWMNDVWDDNWMYIGYDLTGYPTGLLPQGSFTTGTVLDNQIYQFSVSANPDVFMLDWNKSLKQKLADLKKQASSTPPPYPPETGTSEEDINVNEVISMINEVIEEQLKEVNATRDDSGNVIHAQGAPGSVIRFVTENPKLIRAMKDWVLDCQWEDIHGEEDVEDMDPEELLRGIQKNYAGGIKAFIQDANSMAEVPVGYKNENMNDEMPDGYTNDFQRAFAHSQATQPRPENEMSKAKELAKQGKFVVIIEDNIHCKSTDAVLGTCVSIHKVCNTAEEAEAEVEKIAGGSDHVGIVTPDSVKEPEKIDTKTDDSDIPFEGVGYVYDKDMKKDPKHIPGERWRVKFQESVSRKEVKDAIRSVINEMWSMKETLNDDKGKPLPKDVNQVLALMDRLKEGEYIWFSNDAQGRSNYGYGVDCKAEGDYSVLRTLGPYGDYLETDEDKEDFAKGVVADTHLHYYFIGAIPDYKKRDYRYSQEDDQQPGHYELYGPDRPSWQDIYEGKSLNEIITGYDDMIELIKKMSPQEQEELNKFVKGQQGSAYDAVLKYFESKSGSNNTCEKCHKGEYQRQNYAPGKGGFYACNYCGHEKRD